MILYIGTRHVHNIDISSLRRRNDINKIILMNEQEHNYMNFGNKETLTFGMLIDWVNERNIELVIVNGWRNNGNVMHDVTKPRYNCIKEVIAYETAFFNIAHNSFSRMINKKDFHLNSAEDIKYTFVSLNNKPHYHRCLMVDMLEKHNLIENQAISWIITTTEQDFSNGYQFKHWKEKKLALTDTYAEVNDSYKMMPTEYYSSFVQVVNESTMLCDFITEKTTMPLFLQKPFVVFNTKGYNFWLKELGFELYDEIFDYSFDSIDDPDSRFEAGAIEISRINNMSREQQFMLYKEVVPKLEYNKKLAAKLAMEVPEIVKPIWNGTQVDSNCKIFSEDSI